MLNKQPVGLPLDGLPFDGQLGAFASLIHEGSSRCRILLRQLVVNKLSRRAAQQASRGVVSHYLLKSAALLKGTTSCRTTSYGRDMFLKESQV